MTTTKETPVNVNHVEFVGYKSTHELNAYAKAFKVMFKRDARLCIKSYTLFQLLEIKHIEILAVEQVFSDNTFSFIHAGKLHRYSMDIADGWILK